MSEEELHESIKGPDEAGEDIRQPDINFCTVRVGDTRLSIPIGFVKEITDLEDLLPIPGCPRHIRGLINLRGEVLPVIDMAYIYNSSYTQHERKLVVVEHGNETIALLADGMPNLVEERDGELMTVSDFFDRYRVT